MIEFNVPSQDEVSSNNAEIFAKLNANLGFVPNLYASMAYSDTALANYLQFQGAKSSFTNKEKEVINLVVSEFNNCKYCKAAHTALGKMNGFSEAQILDIRAGHITWDAKLAALANLTLAILSSKGSRVESELQKFIDQGYTKGSLVDLNLAIADKIVMNYLHNTIQIPVDFPMAEELDEVLS